MQSHTTVPAWIMALALALCSCSGEGISDEESLRRRDGGPRPGTDAVAGSPDVSLGADAHPGADAQPGVDAAAPTDGAPRPDASPTFDAGPCTPVALVTGRDMSPPPSMREPALNVPYTDPDYHLRVTRVTDPSQVTDHDRPTRVRHEYSRRPAFNADSSLVLEDSDNGWFRLYRVNADDTFTFVRTLDVDDNQEPNWDPVRPNVLYFLQSYGGGLTISTYDVTTNAQTVYRDLAARVRALFPTARGMWTKGEGRPSDDGRIWCLEVGHGGGGGEFVADGFISYDLVGDRILGHLAVTSSPDHISTSPRGDYCVPSWDLPTGTRAYTVDFARYTQLHDRSEHSDLGISRAGDEVLVYTAYDGADAGNVMMVRLSDGVRQPLFELYGANNSTTGIHISATNRLRPGYAVVSFEECTENYGARVCNPATQWFFRKVIAVELAPSPRIFNLAHDFWGDAGYFGETQAVASPDLTRVLFASSWGGTAETSVHDYMIRIPACSLP
jgi:hypothetical protein